ncbi:SirB1 family protein [uncultured Sphingomonas sp.]|uniref:SirB1 family protein n=1 Tax=uncultured Sphingomonas sp. TaxID=158754 RepID=UPI0035C95982
MDDELTNLGLIDEGDIVLDEAALSLALLDHPETDPTPYQELLEEIAVRLDAAGDDTTGAEERADALAQVLSREYGFTGDRETYDDPANADLIEVLDRRRGLPVSLSILYVAAARRVGWRAEVLDIPGHVLVLIGSEAAPVIVDPFRGGIRVGRDELAALLTASDAGSPAIVGRVAAMPNRAVLVRLLLNQATRAERTGKGRRALELYGRMTAMAPGYGHAWWERARLELVDGDVPAARCSLTAMLEITREPGLRLRVSNTLRSLPAS